MTPNDTSRARSRSVKAGGRGSAPLRSARWVLVATTLVLAAPSVHAQCAAPPLVGSSTASGDRFATSVDLDGMRLIAGAPRENSPASDAGAAYVFERSAGAWSETARLVASDATSDDRFGSAVDLDGDDALVGAPKAGAGAVYAFVRGPAGWSETQRLPHSGNEPGFGTAVAIVGDMAIASAVQLNGSAPDSVYVFGRVGGTWIERQRIAMPNVYFGGALAFDGERFVAGAVALQRAHVYERQGNQFVETAVLVPAAPMSPATQFGVAVALEGERIVVGANVETSVVNLAGAAYVFERVGGSWVETQRLAASDPQFQANFGASVALEGGRLLVGSPNSDGPGTDQGKVYVFELQGGSWNETRTIRACAGTQLARLGSRIALDGGRAVLAAPFDNAAGSLAGAAYVVDLLGPLGTRYCPAVLNSSGAPARTEVRGVSVVAANELLLETTELPPDRFGYYLTSMSQRFLPMLGGGAGNLCLDLPIVRFAGSVLNSGPEGAVELALDLTALPPGTTFLPGDTWSFQYWFRDVGNTSNTSDAVAVTFQTGGAPVVQFPVTYTNVVEQATQLQVLVTLSQPAAGPVSVTWAESGTATPQVDYRVESPNPLVIPTGQTEAVLLVTIAEDALQEPDETVILDLVSASGGVLGTALQHRLTIEDDD